MRKKTFLTIAICLMTVVYASAQESNFEQNDNVVNLGLGFGSTYYGRSYIGFAGYTRLPTFLLSYERCIIGSLFNDQSSLGIGGIGGYTYVSHSSWTSTDIMFGVRAAMHYAFIDRLDTYAGVMAGYDIYAWKWKGSSETIHTSGSGGFTPGVFVGGRYYFAGPIAVYAELGYGFTLANVGIALKF